MATVSTGAAAKLLWPGLNELFGVYYKNHPLECTEIFGASKSSDKNWEEDYGLMTFGLAPVKAEGTGISYDEWKQTYLKRYTHIVYGLGCIITREMLEDDQYNIARIISGKGDNMVNALSFSLRTTKETVAANVLNRAFNSSYTGGDAKELLSTAHPLGGAGTFSNRMTVDADISEAALEQACIDIDGFVDERSNQIAVRAKKVIVHRNNQFDISRILESTLQNDSSNNAINALAASNSIPEGFVRNHYLTDTDAWFIKTDCPNGMKHFERRGAEFQTDNDFDTENAKFKATERYSFGWTDPRGMYGSSGA